MKNSWWIGAFAMLITILACERTGDKLGNAAPETKMVVDAINLTGDNRLNSVVNLSWIGTDKDGYVTGYDVSLDNITWAYTNQTDSTFSFELDAGSDSTDIDLYIRAIDNEGTIDPTPAYLRIPLKNTPPIALFNGESFPNDSTLIVTTFEWDASDIDGNESITKAFLKINDGTWTEIDKNQKRISVVPTTPSNTGTTDATIYYGTNTSVAGPTIDGLKVGDTNLYYIKVVDLANSESKPDTSAAIYVHPKTSELLVISGDGALVQNEYRRLINTSYGAHDFLDYEINSGENQPKYWNPTFELLLLNYEILVQFGNGTTYTNGITGQRDILLGFSAPFIQNYSTNGGKSLIINTFSSNNDVSNIATIMPFDSLSSSSGQAVIQVDSAMVPVYNSSNYPSMNPVSILLGMDPFTLRQMLPLCTRDNYKALVIG